MAGDLSNHSHDRSKQNQGLVSRGEIADQSFNKSEVRRERLDLEELVKFKLIDISLESQMAVLSKPENQEKLKELLVSFVGGMMKSLDASEQEISKMKSELIENMDRELLSPENLKQIALNNAKNQWKTLEDIEAEFDNSLYKEIKVHIRDREIAEQAIEKIKEANLKLAKSLVWKKEVITALADIAENEGVDRGVTLENQSVIIRKHFPTREDYKKMSLEAAEDMKAYMQNIAEIVDSFLGGDKSLKRISDFYTSFINDSVDSLMKTGLEESVNQIYEEH